MNKTFTINTTSDLIVYFYAILVANNDNVLDFNDFIQTLDENPELIDNMSGLIASDKKKEGLKNNKKEKK